MYLTYLKECNACQGSGLEPDIGQQYPIGNCCKCCGEGTIPVYAVRKHCYVCNGTGNFWGTECGMCEGAGYTWKTVEGGRSYEY